ncbi:TetR/AcrR family transcriptional regulator [Brevibacterium jeotgali]|nr:TetR/AcrR family transcriptional regulator [Brevibacterium jeotgali]
MRDAGWTNARDIRRDVESETKSALITAARRVFSEEGFGGTTIGEITTRADVSRATFYVYFATKSEMFRVVTSQLRDEVLEAHHFTGQIADEPLMLARASTEAFVDLYSRNVAILDEIAKRAHADSTVAALQAEMVDRPARRILRFMVRLREEGLAKPSVSEDYSARLMRAVLLDAATAARDSPERFDYFVDQATRVFFALIGFTGDLAGIDAMSAVQVEGDSWAEADPRN